MAVIHMETPSVQALAKQMLQNADVMQQHIEVLYSQVHSLPWEGTSSELYRNEFTAFKRRFDSLCMQCETLGLRVQREVDEWLQVDNSGKEGFTVAPGYWERTIRDINNLKYLIHPATLDEGFEELVHSPAGKDLIDYATKNKVRIDVKGDGSYGYQGEDAQVIEVDASNGVGAARYGDGKIFVDEDILNRKGTTPEQLAELIGHEIQHAVDDKTGLYYRAEHGEDLNKYTSLDPAQQEVVRQELAKEIGSRVDSEVRAYERSEAIYEDRSFQDDGVNTGSERQAILDHKLETGSYESYYEKSYAEAYPGLEFDVWIDANGNTQVNIIQTNLTPPPTTPVMYA